MRSAKTNMHRIVGTSDTLIIFIYLSICHLETSLFALTEFQSFQERLRLFLEFS